LYTPAKKVVLFTAAGSYEYFILGLIEHDSLGRALGHADAAGLAVPDADGGDTFSVYFRDLPWTHPDTGETGYTFIAFYPGGLAFVQDVLISNITLFISHIPERLYDLRKTDILRTDKNTAFALGAEPEKVRFQEPVFQAHSDHVDDLPGVKVGNCLAYRTDTAAGTT